ncbi:hypothetical protein ACWGI8_21720 [Streptomyces sp. NPDC054841]
MQRAQATLGCLVEEGTILDENGPDAFAFGSSKGASRFLPW